MEVARGLVKVREMAALEQTMNDKAEIEHKTTGCRVQGSASKASQLRTSHLPSLSKYQTAPWKKALQVVCIFSTWSKNCIMQWMSVKRASK